ncbi:MAG: thioredoxin family protein [Verrucomicrobiae bacterium]
MASTESLPPAAGALLPGFLLRDVLDGREYFPAAFAGASGLLVVFLCRHCPYVVHARDELAKVAAEFSSRGLQTVGICSNDAVAYPDDAPDKLREMRLPFPVLYDATQDVARAFGAVCTPDIFLYDAEGRLFYRGRLDDSTPGNGRPVTGRDLRQAILDLLAGLPPPAGQSPSIGCSIKWKK